MVETAEDRRRKKIKEIMNENDEVDGQEYENLSFVHVPHDESLPLKELTMQVPKDRLGSGDLLVEELKPFFKALSKKLDVSLFQDQAATTLGSSDTPVQVSENSLQEVADQGQVESFCLVHPMSSNKFRSVNIYLDEVGMLKRLPLNKRAAGIALRAGFNPPPKFYGDVFLGRISCKPVLKNEDFKVGKDTSPDAEWIQNATMENLEHQTEMNKITGKHDLTQPSADGENGIAKEEVGYSWTQTDEEIEIVVPIPSNDDGKALSSKEVKAGELKVKFLLRKVSVSFQKEDLLSLKLYNAVDPDGCTWTLDVGQKETSLIITCEKGNVTSWPRITE